MSFLKQLKNNKTSKYKAWWSLRHSALLDNYRLSQQRIIFADEMYPMTCVEWAADPFGL